MKQHPFIEHVIGCDKTTVTVSTDMLMSNFVEFVYETIGHNDVVPFIKSLEACAEDWNNTEELSRYFVTEMQNLYIDDDTKELQEKKESYVTFLKQQIKAFEEG